MTYVAFNFTALKWCGCDFKILNLKTHKEGKV